jgi:hypothetical protein
LDRFVQRLGKVRRIFLHVEKGTADYQIEIRGRNGDYLDSRTCGGHKKRLSPQMSQVNTGRVIQILPFLMFLPLSVHLSFSAPNRTGWGRPSEQPLYRRMTPNIDSVFLSLIRSSSMPQIKDHKVHERVAVEPKVGRPNVPGLIGTIQLLAKYFCLTLVH